MDVQITGMGLDSNKTKTSHLVQLEFNDINSKKGFPTQQLIAAIFRSAGLKDYLKGINESKSTIKKIIEDFKGADDL